jgi:hypothetical protein
MRGSWKPQDEADGSGSPQFDALPAGNLWPSARYVGERRCMIVIQDSSSFEKGFFHK